MKSKAIRYPLYLLCFLAPAVYVLVGEGSLVGKPAPPAEPRQVTPKPGGIGPAYFPNVPLTTHEGQEVRFYDDLIKDKIVLINFMYARCEGVCPGTTANLRKVQRKLGDLIGSKIFIYSITLKPEEDSPEDLATYAALHDVGPGWWFLTGAPDDVESLRQALGFTDPDPVVDADKSSHIGMLLYGNETHQQWAACPCLTDADQMIDQILWLVPEEDHPPRPQTTNTTVTGVEGRP